MKLSKLFVVLAGVAALAFSANRFAQAMGQTIKQGSVKGSPTMRSRHVQSLIQKGSDAFENKEYVKAAGFFSGAVKAAPRNPVLYLFLGRTYDRTGQQRLAFDAYRKVVQGLPGSSSSTQRDPEVLAHFGDLASMFGSQVEASKAYAGAASFGPQRFGSLHPARSEDSILSRMPAANAHVAAGIRYSFEADGVAASSEFLQAKKLAPKSPVATYDLGFERYQMGQREEARRLLAEAETLSGPTVGKLVHAQRKSLGLAGGEVNVHTAQDGKTTIRYSEGPVLYRSK